LRPQRGRVAGASNQPGLGNLVVNPGPQVRRDYAGYTPCGGYMATEGEYFCAGRGTIAAR
jgi:hypothetical protein